MYTKHIFISKCNSMVWISHYISGIYAFKNDFNDEQRGWECAEHWQLRLDCLFGKKGE